MADFYVDENGRITTKKRNKNKILPNYTVNTNGDILLVEEDEEDIAPVKTTVSQTPEKRTWFDTGAFDDGYQFGDVTKTILGSVTDIGENIGSGIMGMGEKALDALMWAAPYISQAQFYADGGGYNIKAQQAFQQANTLAKAETEKLIAKDLYDEEKIAKTIITAPVKKLTGIDAETDSVFGEKSDSLVQSAGQLGATVALSAAGVPWYLTTGVTSFGGETENALKQGASMEEAGLSAAITAGAEILTEKISGGISFGGKTLDDALTKELSRIISNKTVRTLAKLGVDAVGEGSEEVLSGVMSAIGQKLTYAEEKELQELFTAEDAWESFIGGAVLGGGSSAINAIKSNKQGVDSVTGFNEVEQTVVDKVYKDRVAELEKDGKVSEKQKRKVYDETISDMDKGYISIDTIEEALGGETYTNYKSTVESEDKLLKEFDELYKTKRMELSEEQSDRLAALKPQAEAIRKENKREQLKKQLSDEVAALTKDSRLAESFAERSRRGQTFEADLEQYDEKQRAIVQKAVDSGILNNTRRTHEFVDMVARIAADKGVAFDFTNNAKLKESGFAVEGKTVNGYVTKDGITVNIQSAKSLNSVVGHEIAHVLEGTELYTELQKAVFQYAETKGEAADRRAVLEKLYEGVADANIDAELTADLVGDYLFTDSDFINNLSANHRNVFQKIYDEIKYLLKVATAGSKEARELEKVKRAFEKAYRDGGKAQADTKYSLAPVAAVQPKSGAWHAGASTEEVRAAHPTLYAVDETATEERNPTQVKGTVSSYRKVYSALQAEGFDGTILDASSGLGYGTKAGIEEFGFNVEDIEPYPDKSYHPKHTDYSALDKKYDVIISNAVLNVLPQDQRDALVVKMGELLNEGGRMFINVRGKDVLNASGKIAIDEAGMEYFIPRTAKTGSYQKGFTKPELIAYLEDALGDGFTVTPGSKVFGGSTPTAIVAKKGGAKYSLTSDSEGRQLAPAVAKRFANSKVVDENGDLRVVYHGTTYGEFSVFSKEHGNVENDFGVGFYFSSSDSDVSEHYDGGGPDFENKVARRAEQIAAEEDVDYEEAEQRAREELFRGGHKFEVYLNIENPAIVGETTLFSQDEAMEEYNEEDYDDYDDYIADVEQAVSDKIESIVWDVERKTDVYSVDGLADVLFEAYYEGGIGIEELKAKVNELYLEDENGNLAGKEVVRQIIESLGYDGIIDPTVSGKWNMDMEEGTTHYIAFKPNQIKAVTNETPTDNLDIHRSLSRKGAQQRTFGNYNVYGKDIALEEAIAPVRQDIAPATVAENATVQEAATYEEPLEAESPYAEIDRLTEQLEEMEQRYEATFAADDYETAEALLAEMAQVAVRITELEKQLDADVQERLDSFEDADAPIVGEAPYSESTDNVTLPKKMVQDIARAARKALGFPAKQVQTMRALVEKFSQGEIDSEQLHDEIAQRFHTITETGKNADVVEVKKELRDTPINVSEDIKSSFADYTASVVRPNFGKIRFTKNPGVGGVDMVYDELSRKFPGFFPADIIQPANQLQRIIEVANMDATVENSYEIDEATLEAATDAIVRSVNEYRSEQRLKMSEQDAFESFNSLMRDADRYAPIEEGDIAPVRADVAPAAEPVQESAPRQIRTVPERLAAELQAIQTELKNVRDYREGSNEDFDAEIAELQTDYYERRNKNTKAANDILRRIERVKARKAREDARYAKRINDLEAQEAKRAKELRDGESVDAQRAMRGELYAQKIEEMRAELAADGYDLDEVLKNAKNLPTFSTVDNTPERVNEKTFGYKVGQIINRLTVDRVRQHTTEGVKWLNGITNRNDGLLAQLSKQYNIKPKSKESAAAQMYAEGYFVDGNGDRVAYGDAELAQDFPDLQKQANIKGLAADPRIRQFYDETLAKINDSRTRNAYPAIKPLDNYFLHFRAMDDTFSRLGIPFNPNDIKAKDLPTDLNGVTADLKPGQPYFASAKHRRGFDTSFDLLGGLERYAVSAMPQMYLIDDIQMHRAFRNYIADSFGQAHGLDHLETMTEEEVQERLKDVYGSHLSTYARFLTEEGNVLAGKTALIDRGLEGIIGRRGMTFFDTLNRQVGANMVGFNVSSSLTNFIAPVQAFAKTNKAAFVKGFAQTVANRVGAIAGKTDGFAENNPTMIRRQGADRFYRTPWQKVSDLGYALMGGVDSFSTEVIVRGKYNELVSKGMSAEQAVEMTDKWASRLMGDRSLGLQPQLYNSKMLGIFTKFQLEVRNQLDSMFYDTIQEKKLSNEDIENGLARNAKTAAQVTSTLAQMAVVSHLFGKAFEAVAGYNPAFDIIEAIVKAFGWDDEEDSEDTVLDNLGQGLLSIAEDMPYSSLILDGGRIPISSALPITQLIKGEDKYGNEKSRWETVAETAPYWLLPGGYGQIKKTKQGLGMFDEDLPIAGSYTDSGNLRFTVEDTLASRVQAAVFGQYASSNARDYFDNERQSLKKNQIQELVDVDIPIREYWDYRDGLNEQETLAEKFDYIAGLDLPIDKKNILINNVVDRKEAVDLTDYDLYANYEEFDFAVKNPEKYDFLQSVGVSVAEYNSFDDDTKDAYNWAYQNPEKHLLSRAVTDDVAVYRQYTKALNDISADKDESGKSISGSRKTKVINYLNNLDADYYTKIMLFKMEYNADDTYNREIIEYLNGRSDISYEEEVTILQELGFTVTADGTVRW